jgi:hypothetical protein
LEAAKRIETMKTAARDLRDFETMIHLYRSMTCDIRALGL